ncbi:hypothetical protein [Streptomyces sp. NPDC001719]
MARIWDIAGVILGLLGKIKNLFEGSDKKVLVTSVITSSVTAAVFIGGYLLMNHHPRDNDVKLGGMDLVNYCKHYGYGNNDEDFCSSPVDLKKACISQHPDKGVTTVTGSHAYDRDCHSPSGPVGSIDVPQYCKDTFPKNVGVQAYAMGDDWVCRMKIDKEAVCIWSYPKKDIQARKNEDGNWYCYGPR